MIFSSVLADVVRGVRESEEEVSVGRARAAEDAPAEAAVVLARERGEGDRGAAAGGAGAAGRAGRGLVVGHPLDGPGRRRRRHPKKSRNEVE